MTVLDPRTESTVFNRMASYYDRYRPGYPEMIIRAVRDKIGEKANIRVLEIGAGSGKATAQFAPFGWEMLCLEPGEDLAAEGRRRFAGRNITFAASRLEEYSLPDSCFDAVISAQAFHWIEKPLGFRLCAAALKQNGWLMPFWNIEFLGKSAEDQTLLAVLEQYGAFTATMKESDYPGRVTRISDEISASGCFDRPEIIQERWTKVFTAEEYFGYILTGSVFSRSPEEQKQACFAALKTLEAKYGGIRRQFVCELYAARKNAGTDIRVIHINN